MSKGISTSLGKNEFFTLNLIIEKEAYRINGLPFDRTATNEEMLHLTKDVLQIFQEIEHKITNQARLHLSLEDKLLLTPEECQNYLIKLARCGQDAYKQFFFNQDAQEKFSELRSYPENMKFAPTIFSNYLLFPWEVIYEGDYKKGESEMFWGFHYPISRYLPVNHTPKRQFLLSLNMLFCLHHTLSYAHKQEQPEIEKVLIKNNGKLYLLEFSRKIGKLENGEDLLDHFYQNQYNVLHFACHCRPCRQYEDEVDALIISFINENNNNQQIELEIKHFNRVNGSFQCQPLIFLNACQSAGGVDDLRKTFNLPNIFIKYGAASVIATVCPMPDVFAAAFSKVFYKFFIGKKMLIGKALCETRRFFLEKYNNPLGLAYGLYSPHDYQIAQTPTMQAFAKQTPTTVGMH
ncbi:CHAT domain-containing protein [Scytonema hofmannii FACHB-248]|uniref:CHAT domain-containing protein n=1 Tax=Scytonema hofmannii FACHB-248 TaxID=1842502 RepID=A0ABR8GNP5_9CYAN|nr:MULTISPECIES: CHAT domain-containing protein [Nostocales]MBD2604778.1 CHAT domain-containing protein [Scytonema hofmannii FACHB-248]